MLLKMLNSVSTSGTDILKASYLTPLLSAFTLWLFQNNTNTVELQMHLHFNIHLHTSRGPEWSHVFWSKKEESPPHTHWGFWKGVSFGVVEVGNPSWVANRVFAVCGAKIAPFMLYHCTCGLTGWLIEYTHYTLHT